MIAAPGTVRSVETERGDIILGWLTKLVLVLSVLGVLGFDAVSLVQARFQASDRAAAAASAAAAEYASSKDVQKAYNAAFATTVDNDTIETTTFKVAPDGTVSLRLHHEATTLLVQRIAPLRGYADAAGEGRARPPS